MNKKRKYKGHWIMSSALMLGTLFSFAQESNCKELENNLIEIYHKAFPFFHSDRDSLEYYSHLFTNRLTGYIEKHPETLKYSFQKLQDSLYFSIVTSEDQDFRMYSWDTWLGGTMDFYKNLYQFRSGNRIYTTDLGYGKEEGDIGTFATDIHTLKTNNQLYYLVLSGGKTSTRDAYETIQVYSIKGKAVTDKVKLIKTPAGLSSYINVEYDFFSVDDSLQTPLHLIKYDAGRKIIHLPFVQEHGKVTRGYILYQFKGKYFHHILTKKGGLYFPDEN
jgi:hypothetical protein